MTTKTPATQSQGEQPERVNVPCINGKEVKPHPLDIPRSTTRLRGASAEVFLALAQACEPSSCSKYAMTAYIPEKKRAYPKQPLMDLVEYMTGLHGGYFLGCTSDLKWFEFLRHECMSRNEARGRRARDIVHPEFFTTLGSGLFNVVYFSGKWTLQAKGAEDQLVPQHILAKLFKNGPGDLYITDCFSESNARLCCKTSTETFLVAQLFPELTFDDEDYAVTAAEADGIGEENEGDEPDAGSDVAASQRRNRHGQKRTHQRLCRRRRGPKKEKRWIGGNFSEGEYQEEWQTSEWEPWSTWSAAPAHDDAEAPAVEGSQAEDPADHLSSSAAQQPPRKRRKLKKKNASTAVSSEVPVRGDADEPGVVAPPSPPEKAAPHHDAAPLPATQCTAIASRVLSPRPFDRPHQPDAAAGARAPTRRLGSKTALLAIGDAPAGDDADAAGGGPSRLKLGPVGKWSDIDLVPPVPEAEAAA